MRPFGDELAELAGDPRDRVVDLLLRQVAEHDGDLQPAEDSSASWRAMRPAPTIPTSLDAARLGVRDADARFARRSTRSNA